MERRKRALGKIGDRRGVVPYKKEGTRRGLAILVVVLIVAGVVALLFSGAGQGLGNKMLEGIVSFSVSHVFGGWEAEDEKDGDDTEAHEEAETVSKSEDSDDETFESEKKGSEESDAADSEGESADPGRTGEGAGIYHENRVLQDLSSQERGAEFFINHTMLTLDTNALLNRKFLGDSYGDGRPVVLILHSHTSETYYDADDFGSIGQIAGGVVSVGERICVELQRLGVPAVHCTVIHDGDSDQSPQRNAGKTVETMIRIYPSIRYIIDVDRMDEVDEEGMKVGTISPLGTAQLQLTVGRGGEAMEDLALALCLRRELNQGGRGICMPVVLSGAETVGNASAYYLKLEVGGSGNTVEEALMAGVHFSHALASLLR